MNSACNNMELQPDEIQEVVTTQIVEFHEDGSVEEPGVFNPQTNSTYLASAKDTLVNDVIGYLERPVEVANFIWLPTQAAGAQVSSAIELPRSWSLIPMIDEKIAGFAFLRCDFTVKIQVNAQPFNAGRLLVMFAPYVNNERYVPSNRSHFGGLTGFSRAELDLSESTTVELRVPYCGNMTHFDLTRGIGGLGSVYMYVYSQLTGVNNVEGTIWVQAENIDIQVPTGVTQFLRVQTQSGSLRDEGPPSKEKGAKKEVDQKKERNKGTIESVASSIGSVTRSFGSVPVIGVAASAVSFVADAVSGVASLFGWSKPNDNHLVTMMRAYVAPNMANFNGDTKAKSLALDARNEVVPPHDIFGTDNDEMSISFLVSKFTYLSRFKMAQIDVPNSVIYSTPVTPCHCSVFVVGTNRYRNNTLISYLSEMFDNWRGSLEYKFKIVKTPFHSGRIRISFVPGADINTVPSTIDFNKCYSQIYDIRSISEIDFSVPFVYNAPWMSLNRVYPFTAVTETQHTGMVYVEVLNALRNPTTAENSIEFLVEVRGGEDFQFAYPTNSPRYQEIPNSSFTTEKGDEHVVVPTDVLYFNGKTTRELNKLEKPKAREYTEEQKLKYRKLNELFWPPPEESVEAEQAKAVEEKKNEIVQNLEEKGVEITPEVSDNAGRCALPMRSDLPHIADLDRTKKTLPTHQYTVDVQTKFYHAYLKQFNVTEESVKQEIWDAILFQYPAPSCPIVVKTQSGLIKQKVINDPQINTFGMGEAVTSLRQVLKRYEGFLGELSPTLIGGFTFGVFPYMTSAGVIGLPGYDSSKYITLFDKISLLYRFQTGSMKLLILRATKKVGTTNPETANAAVWIRHIPGWRQNNPDPSNWYRQTALPSVRNDYPPVQIYYPGNEEAVEIVVPFYQRYPTIPTFVGGVSPADVDQPGTLFRRFPANNGSAVVIESALRHDVYRSIGEDFSFGYSIGPPISRMFP